MSTKRLAAAAAPTPDFHCANCGTGLFYTKAYSHSVLQDEDGADEGFYYDLCLMCAGLEEALIQSSGTRQHPQRLKWYAIQHRKFHP